MQTVDEFLGAKQSPQTQTVDQFLAKNGGMQSVDEFLSGGSNTDSAPITQAFGNVNPDVEVMSGGVNNGTDYGFTHGDPIHAPKGQWVVEDSYADDTQPGYIGNTSNSGYGNSVVLRNAKTGESIRLSHLSTNFAKPGMTVQGGTLLGNIGDTGNTSGAHLDAEDKDAQGNYGDINATPYAY